MKKIGLIGIGSIGQYLFQNLQQEGVEIAFIYARQKIEGESFSHLIVNNLEEVEAHCKAGVNLVVEAATFDAVKDFAPMVLQYSDMAILSSTALADQSFYDQIKQLCLQYRHRLIVPHGAVMGLDGIMDAKEMIESITITTTKSPASLGRADSERAIVYEGATREVCKLYPRNVNVHATVALAGLGFDRTISRIISDPKAAGNGHVIEVTAPAFQFRIETLSDTASKVSSAYTLVSACNSIKRVLLNKGIVIV